MMGEQEVREAARPAAVLTTLRLTKDELGNRIVCVAGSLQECSVAEVQAAATGGWGPLQARWELPCVPLPRGYAMRAVAGGHKATTAAAKKRGIH